MSWCGETPNATAMDRNRLDSTLTPSGSRKETNELSLLWEEKQDQQQNKSTTMMEQEEEEETNSKNTEENANSREETISFTGPANMSQCLGNDIPLSRAESTCKFNSESPSILRLPSSHMDSQKTVKRYTRNVRILPKFSWQQRTELLDPSSLSFLDLVVTDLDLVKRSFVAHAHAFSRGDLDDMYKLARNVTRGIKHSERKQQQQQLRKRHISRQPHRQKSTDSPRSSWSNVGDADASVCATSFTSILDASICCTEATSYLPEAVSQGMHLLHIWLYDRHVQEFLKECRSSTHASKKGERLDISGISSRMSLRRETKTEMMEMRSPPTPLFPHELDIHDELGVLLGDRDKNSPVFLSNIAEKDLSLPMPVFVYIFSRALFRLHYLKAFPPDLFTRIGSSSSAQKPFCTEDRCLAKQTTSSTKGNIFDAFSSREVRCNESHLRDSTFLLEECRRIALQFFENIDTTQKGVITWFSFTDSLMEQVGVRLRLIGDKDSSEDVTHNAARVFDEYISGPFPSILQRLGYVGAVAEVRHNESFVIIEGVHDFALCDSSHGPLIHSRLLVRTADVLFLHRQGAQEEWDADRWEAATEAAAVTEQEQKYNGKILRYENTRSCDNRYKLGALDGSERAAGGDAGDKGVNASHRTGGSRTDLRPKPLIESALQVHGLGPHFPTSIVTLHNDLLIRFFSMEQHIFVVPESVVVSSAETITAMDWCDPGADGDASLKFFLFMGTRTGNVYKVDLQAILQRIACTRNISGDLIVTGMAAAATVHEKLQTHILQQQVVHKDFVTSLCATGSGMLLSSSLDGTVVLSRANNLSSLRSFRIDHDAGVRFACITPLRNTIVTLSTNNCVSLWANTQQGTHVDLYDPISPHYFPIVAVKVDESLKQLITLDSSGHGKVWDIRTSMLKTSFSAVSEECFSTFRHMYTADDASTNNGFRLFDMDGSDKKRPRLSNNTGNQREDKGLLRTTLASIEAANKARQLHPVRSVAYDAYSKRLFVSGVRNTVMCAFSGGLTAINAHSSPLCHLLVCERNHWLISTSDADCRVWDYPTGILTLGVKANDTEFIMARISPVFTSMSTQSTGLKLVASTWDTDRYTLDACKQPISSINDIIQAVKKRSDAFRRDGAFNMPSGRVAKISKTLVPDSLNSMLTAASGTGGTSTAKVQTRGDSTNAMTSRGLGNEACVSSSNSNTRPESDGFATDGDARESWGDSDRILCAHVDPQERFIFYALSNGDIRMHNTDSGRLSKTFLTTPPSTDLVLSAVLHSRHLFTSNRGATGRMDSALSDTAEGAPRMLTSSRLRVQDVAFVLHCLLNQNQKLPLQKRERLSIHMEAVGMMTLRASQELGVVYADGVIRLFLTKGNSVHAQRLIISEFLVSKALSYLQLDNALPQRLLSSPRGPRQNKRDGDVSKGKPNFMVEADAVSFIAVSKSMELICLVQVNGCVSVMDMNTPAGSVVQMFTLSAEVSAISFLGLYPCLVVGDTNGFISFFLVKGATMLALLDDFYKSVSLYHRKCSRQGDTSPLEGNDVGAEVPASNTNGVKKGKFSRSASLIWWFHTPGLPTVLHFDPVLCTLYVGTQQGCFSSYLLRSLVAACDLHPVFAPTSVGKPFDSLITFMRHQRYCNEQRANNVLLVFFGITPQRAMRYTELKRYARTTCASNMKTGLATEGPIRCKVPESLSIEALQRDARLSFSGPPLSEYTCSIQPSIMWKGSLAWAYETFRPLFYSRYEFMQAGENAVVVEPLFDLKTATLSDLLIGVVLLHRALQLLLLRDCNAEGKQMRSDCTVNAKPSTVVVLTHDDLVKLRECIIESLKYQNELYQTSNHLFNDSSHTLAATRAPEEVIDLDALAGGFSALPNIITADFVEFLFRRNVVHTVKNSPLALLSGSAILERARRERLERAKLLQLQQEIQRKDRLERQKSGLSISLITENSTTQVSVDWDAFIEGAFPNLIVEAMRKRSFKLREQEFIVAEEAESVRCITTQRTGIVFVGCADGSVSVWTQYGCARLHELCPSMMLKESLLNLGNSVKANFMKQAHFVERQRQWQAYATGCYDAKLHESMMQNLDVKYRVAMMKESELVSGVRSDMSASHNGEKKISTRERSGATSIILPDNGCVKSTHTFPSQSFSSSRHTNLPPLERQKELLLAVLNMNSSGMMRKGILLEDLFFLPLRMSVLSVLEDFKVDAYTLAVDIAVARLIGETCGAAEYTDGTQRMDSTHLASFDGRVNRSDVEQRISPSFSQCVSHPKLSWAGESDEAVQDDVFAFLLSVHEKHLADCCTQLKDIWGSISSDPDSNSRNSATRPSTIPRSSTSAKRRSSVYNRTTAEMAHSNTVAWIPESARFLPHYAVPGVETNSNAILVSAFPNTDEQWKKRIVLDLEQISTDSKWITTDEAISLIVESSNGLLNSESLNGLIKSLSRTTRRNTSDALLSDTVSPGGIWDAVKGGHATKGAPMLMEPLLLLDTSIENVEMDDLTPLQRHMRSTGSFFSDTQTSSGRQTRSYAVEKTVSDGKNSAKFDSSFFVTEAEGYRTQFSGSPSSVRSLRPSTRTRSENLPLLIRAESVRNEDINQSSTYADDDDPTPLGWDIATGEKPFRAKFSRVKGPTVFHSCPRQSRLRKAKIKETEATPYEEA